MASAFEIVAVLRLFETKYKQTNILRKKKNLISVLPSILPQSKIFYTQTLLIRRVSLIQAPHSVKIYFLDTVESLVRDHPKCEELVVAARDGRTWRLDCRTKSR